MVDSEGFKGTTGHAGVEAFDRRLWRYSKVQVASHQFCSQPNDWSCGPAVVTMVCRAVGAGEQDPIVGDRCSADQAGLIPEVVLRFCESTVSLGTSNPSLVQALRLLLPTKTIISGNCLGSASPPPPEQRLPALLQEYSIVVINFIDAEDGVGHFSIVQGVGPEGLLLCDPARGPAEFLAWQAFDWRSGFSEPVQQQWYVALR